MNISKYEKYIVDVVNFPVEGIIFKDITPILENPEAYEAAIDDMVELIKDVEFDKIMTCDARGFLLGGPIALKLKKPLVLARKLGKLPRPGQAATYTMEYGFNSLQISKDSIKKNERILIVDDLLATGGSSKACKNIVEKCGAIPVAICHLIELDPLKGRQKIESETTKVFSCIHYQVY